MSDLRAIVTGTKLTPEEIVARTSTVYRELLEKSRHVRSGNFQSIHPADLKRLFAAYDQVFFGQQITSQLGTTPLSFRLSKRLTSTAGTTTRRTLRRPLRPPHVEYEICISTTLLFQTFRDVDRTVTASGVACQDRVEALQRIFEHELIHLVEMLVWSDSNCSAPRFQTITRRLFGHREHTHQLITQRERAFAKFGLRVGDRVAFRMDGRHHVGIINRITRRATVLVETPAGKRYSDGKHYAKFYVPLDLLQSATSSTQRAAPSG